MDFFGVATFLAVLLLGAILTYANARQARALFAAQAVLEDWLLMQIKDRRDARRNQVQVTEPAEWLQAQAGVQIAGLHRLVEKPMAVSFETRDGCRLVVSPLRLAELRDSLRPLERAPGRTGQLIEPLLGRNLRQVNVIERNLMNAGETFDLEASQVGEQLGVRWGEVNRVYFYRVPVRA